VQPQYSLLKVRRFVLLQPAAQATIISHEYKSDYQARVIFRLPTAWRPHGGAKGLPASHSGHPRSAL
jgi:hypothetical protein